jgi:hypothetical protein
VIHNGTPVPFKKHSHVHEIEGEPLVQCEAEGEGA